MIGAQVFDFHDRSDFTTLPEEFDPAIRGIVSRIGQEDVICYDKTKILEILMEGGMDEEDAIEHFEYNIIGSYVGDKTPCFISFTEEI